MMGNDHLTHYFFEECKKNFEFLVDEYNFKIVTKDYTKFSDYIVYKNNTTAIQISLERRDCGIFFELIRLVNGDIPPRPIFITNDTELNRFDFLDFLSIVAPDLKLSIFDHIELLFSPNWKKNINNVLSQLAINLKNYGHDVLTGDFNIFPQLEKIVKQRSNFT
jgi:hypothetical protein